MTYVCGFIYSKLHYKKKKKTYIICEGGTQIQILLELSLVRHRASAPEGMNEEGIKCMLPAYATLEAFVGVLVCLYVHFSHIRANSLSLSPSAEFSSHSTTLAPHSCNRSCAFLSCQTKKKKNCCLLFVQNRSSIIVSLLNIHTISDHSNPFLNADMLVISSFIIN